MTNAKVDDFFGKARRWSAEAAKLRAIILGCGLTEELKWGQPCYTFDNHNIVIIGEFKEYCALLFFKGALMKDPAGLLIRQTENVQVGRHVRFTGIRDIVDQEPTLKAYIHEAIEVEKSGLKIARKSTADFPVAEEFQTKLDEMPGLKTAFAALTPGRQRGYLLYFSAPKQSKTRVARVGKSIPRILEGNGLDD